MNHFEPGWYCLTVRPQKELTIVKSLNRAKFEAFVPVKERWRRKSRHHKARSLVPFPIVSQFVFVKIATLNELFRAYELPSVSGVIAAPGTRVPWRIEDGFIHASLTNQVEGVWRDPDEWQGMRTYQEYSVGDKVEIAVGQFADWEGRVVSINPRTARVLINIFGQEKELAVPLDGARKAA